MKFDTCLRLLSKISNLPLPGKKAQFLMAPMERVKEFSDLDVAKMNPRKAGVMVLFYPSQEDIATMVLMLRKTYKGVHSNQVGFPGGKVEKEDTTMLDTALRETEEEIGISRDQITIVKEMSATYIPPSNFCVYPFIGYSDAALDFIPQEEEVEGLIEVSIADFLAEEAVISRKMSTSYMDDIDVPAFLLNGHVVWGATAMMLSELKELLLSGQE
ncbi:coenzyme A pyrophosphatase [Dokdonia pacifica]|uniref:8-oxo-dGTP pyrophosphatase MutT, NUDIX family n=1 Tax=Dokdonia pacifica TaxID=1627892 RepID=A0A238ZTP5_9FLAO|nr:CoA pyrophosphatase [Dokdonia pacifica]GGG08402.1 coenzyme A pyrophosphatase [Dokdonia pacifica]SNR86381.1 8-oxo-dGTP pyrophosphatase MutT, NUDIX family [Dokdonia pacifica]